MKAMQPWVVCFSVFAFAGAVAAQDPSKEQSSTQQSPSVTQPQSQESQQQQQPQDKQQSESASGGGASAQSKQGQMSVSQLKNQKVTDAEGKELGQIQDVVVDLSSGRVHAVVLSFGGFLGVGDKNFAFAPSELKPGKGNQLMVNVDKKKLENAEGFAKGQWPGMDESYWGRVGGEGRAKASGGEQGAKPNLARASQLMGKQVQDKDGTQVGELKDMQLSLTDGQIQNLIVSVKEGGQATVPAKAISTTGTENKLVLSMNAKELQSQAKKQQGSKQGSASSGSSAQESGAQSGQEKKQ